MSGKPAVGPSYEGRKEKKLLALLITCALAIIAALAEAGTGSIEFGLDEIFRALIGRGDATAEHGALRHTLSARGGGDTRGRGAGPCPAR